MWIKFFSPFVNSATQFSELEDNFHFVVNNPSIPTGPRACIFDVDIPNRKVVGITPTDWERTKIDKDKLAKAREERVK